MILKFLPPSPPFRPTSIYQNRTDDSPNEPTGPSPRPDPPRPPASPPEAAIGGGNCELTRLKETYVTENGVTIIGAGRPCDAVVGG